MLLFAVPGTGSKPRWDPTLGVGPLAFVPKGVSSQDIFLKFNSDFFVFIYFPTLQQNTEAALMC